MHQKNAPVELLHAGWWYSMFILSHGQGIVCLLNEVWIPWISALLSSPRSCNHIGITSVNIRALCFAVSLLQIHFDRHNGMWGAHPVVHFLSKPETWWCSFSFIYTFFRQSYLFPFICCGNNTNWSFFSYWPLNAPQVGTNFNRRRGRNPLPLRSQTLDNNSDFKGYINIISI